MTFEYKRVCYGSRHQALETVIDDNVRAGWEFMAVVPGVEHVMAEYSASTSVLFRRKIGEGPR